jgi:acetyl-CoA synthetase (ADP-forming)/acetyltransferase
VLRRCGVLGVESLADLLAAAETLTRARPARGEALAIVTNAIGPAQLAADAVLRDGLALADLLPETLAAVERSFPGAFGTRAADAVPGSKHIAYGGPDEALRLAELATLLAAAPEVGGVLLVHAPTGLADTAAMAAIGAAAGAMKLPLLVCAMGQSTGEAHRAALAEAGVPAFATPEEAVRGFRHLVQHRRIRAAARELPDSEVPDLGIDPEAASRALAGAGQGTLPEPATRALLEAYGIAMGEGPGAATVRVALAEDAMFGPVLALGPGAAVDLPPLNPALARALVAQAGVTQGAAALADLLVRVSQLAVDRPEVAALALDPVHLGAAGIRVAAARIVLRRPGRGALAIPPYPTEWVRLHDARGQPVVIRPVRPEDAAAHAAFFARLSPEDVRYRFFSAIRALSAEQVDYEREMALLAVRPAAPGSLEGETVGVARLVREMDAGEAEFAVVVQADAKGAGIASALMRQLLDWGRSKGVREVAGQILADNAPMLAFIRRLGFTVRRSPEDAELMEARLVLETLAPEPPPAP